MRQKKEEVEGERQSEAKEGGGRWVSDRVRQKKEKVEGLVTE